MAHAASFKFVQSRRLVVDLCMLFFLPAAASRTTENATVLCGGERGREREQDRAAFAFARKLDS